MPSPRRTTTTTPSIVERRVRTYRAAARPREGIDRTIVCAHVCFLRSCERAYSISLCFARILSSVFVWKHSVCTCAWSYDEEGVCCICATKTLCFLSKRPQTSTNDEFAHTLHRAVAQPREGVVRGAYACVFCDPVKRLCKTCIAQCCTLCVWCVGFVLKRCVHLFVI